MSIDLARTSPALVSGRDRRYVGYILWRLIAAPHHMQVGAQQQQIVAVDLACDPIGDLEHRDRRAVSPDGLFQAAGIGLGPPQLQDRVAIGNAVLNGGRSEEHTSE